MTEAPYKNLVLKRLIESLVAYYSEGVRLFLPHLDRVDVYYPLHTDPGDIDHVFLIEKVHGFWMARPMTEGRRMRR